MIFYSGWNPDTLVSIHRRHYVSPAAYLLLRQLPLAPGSALPHQVISIPRHCPIFRIGLEVTTQSRILKNL